MDRYFVITDKDEQPLTLFKAAIDDDAETFDEYEYHDGWESSDRLFGYLIDGDPRVVEIDADNAETLFPAAFDTSDNKEEGATLVSKAVDERMFTLGPMYIPNRKDAHAEWTDPDELQKAVWEYVKKGDRRIRLQHNRETVAGEWLEIMAWPYEVEAPIVMKDASESTMKFPANTVFLGVKWEPWAWQLIKAGKLRGYSIGGKAERLLADLPEEYVGKQAAPMEEATRVEAPEPLDLQAEIAKAVAEAIKNINPVVNVVMPEDKPKVRRVERDEHGNIVRIIEEN